MSVSKKYFVNLDLQSNQTVNLKADTLDITTNLASANTKRIVYYNNDYYYSDGTNWILMTNVVPDGGTTGQVLAKTTNSDYELEWVDQTGGGGSGIPFAIASGTDTYTATVTGVTAYTDGDAYLIRFTNGNTTGCTLNINSIGAIQLYTNNDGALIGGDIVSGGQMLCVYNSSLNCFQTIGTSPNTLVSYVTNDDSVTLTKGMPVYAFGGTGDRMTVKRASNLGDPTSAQTVGLVLSTSIGVNQKGFILMQGLLQNLSILPTSTFADGDAIYLGATAGTITNVKPYAPNHLVYLGTVTTASNGNSGRMYVRVQNGYELQELHNVYINSSTLADNNLLAYDSTAELWENKTLGNVIGGITSQYLRGDGSLAPFPTTTGGGSSVAYYMNGSVNQGTFGGNTYYEMSQTAITGTNADFSLTNTAGYIAQFITDANDPALLSIPVGAWNVGAYFSASTNGGTSSFYVELYKYDGSTFTLIASSSTFPEVITNTTTVDLYTTSIAVPLTTLTATDRLAVRFYVDTNGNRTVTLHTQDSHLCEIITTFSTGINTLNSLSKQVQYFAVGTSGTDFNIDSLTDTHTFNLPTASASNRGALSSTDWSTFNDKSNPISISDNGSVITSSVESIDFTGSVTATAVGNAVTVNVTGGVASATNNLFAYYNFI